MTLQLNYAYRYFLKLHTSVVDSQKKKERKKLQQQQKFGERLVV